MPRKRGAPQNRSHSSKAGTAPVAAKASVVPSRWTGTSFAATVEREGATDEPLWVELVGEIADGRFDPSAGVPADEAEGSGRSGSDSSAERVEPLPEVQQVDEAADGRSGHRSGEELHDVHARWADDGGK